MLSDKLDKLTSLAKGDNKSPIEKIELLLKTIEILDRLWRLLKNLIRDFILISLINIVSRLRETL